MSKKAFTKTQPHRPTYYSCALIEQVRKQLLKTRISVNWTDMQRAILAKTGRELSTYKLKRFSAHDLLLSADDAVTLSLFLDIPKSHIAIKTGTKKGKNADISYWVDRVMRKKTGLSMRLAQSFLRHPPYQNNDDKTLQTTNTRQSL